MCVGTCPGFFVAAVATLQHSKLWLKHTPADLCPARMNTASISMLQYTCVLQCVVGHEFACVVLQYASVFPTYSCEDCLLDVSSSVHCDVPWLLSLTEIGIAYWGCFFLRICGVSALHALSCAFCWYGLLCFWQWWYLQYVCGPDRSGLRFE
jgi:hypothetical protein